MNMRSRRRSNDDRHSKSIEKSLSSNEDLIYLIYNVDNYIYVTFFSTDSNLLNVTYQTE